MEKLVTTINHDNQSVEVVKIDGLIGYRFDAVDKESLPLAVELALLQTQKPVELARIINPVVLGGRE